MWNTLIEILVTSIIIAVIWGLLSLPSVFYFLPQNGSEENVPLETRIGYTRADQLILEADEPGRNRWKTWIEILVTSVIIAVIWGLLSLPSVFYFLPAQSWENETRQIKTGCSNYTKSACLQTLIQSKHCFHGVQQNSSNVEIASDVDQEANENTAQLVINGLSFLGASEACRSSFIPFMCLQLFPLCDGNGTPHKPTKDQCISISTVVCKEEWQKALTFPSVREKLPDCESLSVTTENICKGQSTSDNTSVMINQNQSTSITQVTCKDPFLFSNGTCLPQCGKWKQYDDKTAVAVDTIVIISAIVGLGSGIIAMISSCIWRKKIFVFPAVIIFYMSMPSVFLAFVILISFTDRTTLYCSSQNLIQAVDKTTVFCSFIGSVYYYTILQLSIWWICHVTTLFWKIKFPFHAKQFQNKKSIHVLVVLLAVVLPTIPIIVSFRTGGFVISNHPPLVCVSRSSDAAYYTLALPISIIIATGTSLLFLVLVTVIKHTATKETSKTKIHFGTAEKKLLILLCYYVLLGSEALVAFALNAKSIGAFVNAVIMYFICESSGISTSGKCESQMKAYESMNNVGLSILAYVLLGLLPAVSLLFVVQFGAVKRCCTLCIKRGKVLSH